MAVGRKSSLNLYNKKFSKSYDFDQSLREFNNPYQDYYTLKPTPQKPILLKPQRPIVTKLHQINFTPVRRNRVKSQTQVV